MWDTHHKWAKIDAGCRQRVISTPLYVNGECHDVDVVQFPFDLWLQVKDKGFFTDIDGSRNLEEEV